MENDDEAKALASDFVLRCYREGKTIDTIAHAAGWILQILAHLEAQRRTQSSSSLG